MFFSSAAADDSPNAAPFTAEIETLPACPLCGSRSLATWREGWDRQHRLSTQRFHYSRCRDCGLVFLSTRPAEGEIVAFYPREYGPYHAETPAVDGDPADLPRPRRSFVILVLRRALRRFNAALERLVPDRSAARIEELYAPPFAGAVLLDLGCGSPLFLDLARAAGWRTIGLDFSPEVVARVRACGHEALLVSPQIWRQIADLDLVRLHHVLEHLYRPREILAEVYRKMKPGAWLHLGLPNPAGLSSRLFGARWWGLECPRHVMLYREKVVLGLLHGLGFGDFVVIREAVTKDFVRSWGYLLHDLGLIGREDVLRLSGGALAEGLRLPMRLAARLGLADRFHVFARKSERRSER